MRQWQRGNDTAAAPWAGTLLDRRAFLLGLGATAALAACSSGGSSSAPAPSTILPRLDGDPFTLGVASGDPLSDRVILWTRLAPRPFDGGGMPDLDVPVRWEIARDDSFEELVLEGTMTATPAWGHSVHVDATGLDPATRYHYRFQVGEHTSPTGRTKTAPAADASPDRVRFALTACQQYEHGYYTAYPHLAEEDLDVMFFLGDYIYESGPGEDGDEVRAHSGPEVVDLADYRGRYAQYKHDAGLQAAHAAFPWVVIWDDHEVENNYVSAISEDEHPTGAFLRRRAAAYQAWYEHMPVRLEPPEGPDFAIYRSFTYGDLATFYALDTRQYRADQPCNWPVGDAGPPCPEMDEPGRAGLGGEQEAWLTEGFATSTSRWNVLAQQIMFAERRTGLGAIDELYDLDGWDGYRAGRQRVIDAMVDTGVANPVVLTGDIHTCLVADVHQDPHDVSTPVVAAELGGVSLTSVHGATGDLVNQVSWERGLMPHVKFLDASRHGYVRCEATPQRLTADFRLVETIRRRRSPISTGPSWVIEDGTPGITEA